MIGRSARGDVTMKTVEIEPTFESWQAAARALLRDGNATRAGALARGAERRGSRCSPRATRHPAGTVKVPRQFLELGASGRGGVRSRALADPLRHALAARSRGPRALERYAHDPGVRRLHALLTPTAAEPEADSAAPFVPAGAGLDELKARPRRDARDAISTATPLRPSSAAARPDARIVFVGEQPGDQEDLQGAPFVGPAGEVFDRALAEAGPRAREGLRHQRGQALQVRAARQAPDPPDAARDRAQRVPPVARSRARRDQTGRARLPGRDGGPRDLRRSSSGSRRTVAASKRHAGRRRRSRPTIPRPCSAARTRRSRLSSTRCCSRTCEKSRGLSGRLGAGPVLHSQAPWVLRSIGCASRHAPGLVYDPRFGALPAANRPTARHSSPVVSP